jgi:hypothetical protein
VLPGLYIDFPSVKQWGEFSVTQATVNPRTERTERAERTEIVRKVLEYPIPDTVIEKYIDKYGVTEEVARDHERELKRYLAMCLADPEAAYGMFGPVDEFWHTWILFTREWCEFSSTVAGRYIHHRPTTRQERQQQRQQERQAGQGGPGPYQRFLADYPAYFGEEARVEFWPRPPQPVHACANCAGCGTGSCSGCSGGCGHSCSGCIIPGHPWEK